MKKNKLPLRGGLKRKMIFVCGMLVFASMIAFATIGILQLRDFLQEATNAGKSQNKAIKLQSKEALTDRTNEAMMNTISMTAKNADEEFWSVRHDYAILGAQVQEILAHPDYYNEREIPEPAAAKEGDYTLQLVFSDENASQDPKARDLAGKLANLEPMMREIVQGDKEDTVDCYISLPGSISLIMNPYLEKRFDRKGSVALFDPSSRPWYRSAVKKGGFSFTLTVQDYFLKTPEVEYGHPIYVKGKLAAVLGGAIPISTIQDFIGEVGVGKHGFSIMVNDSGHLIYSPRKNGDLAMANDLSSDILKTDNKKLRALILEALEKDRGLRKTEIDGEVYYAAYAHMVSLNWPLITFVPESELDVPTDELLAELDKINTTAGKKIFRGFRQSSVEILAVSILLIFAAFVAAVTLSHHITRPINVMTKRIENVTGDRFVFKMDDIYRTGDEIEILANNFRELSEQMESHLQNILAMTAEKERVNTELALAARIQKDMLPGSFPAFPDRHEFNIYACITPAREVGGDFYDYFFTDEDHLALVMADVSDKGIPAAMFMMMAKSMIRTQAASGLPPEKILETVNLLLYENNNAKMFVTVWLGILDLKTGIMTAANAGHEYPIFKLPGEDFKVYKDVHGFVLGGLDGMKYKSYEVSLPSGTKLFVYTDGVTEARNTGRDLFGMDRLTKALNTAADQSPESVIKTVEDAVAAFVGSAEQADDLTMLCVEYHGKR